MLVWLAAAHASPLEQLARDALAPPPDETSLVLVSIVPHGGPAGEDGLGPRGAVVQLRPEIDGVPVDRLTTVRIDPTGEVRQVRSSPLPTRHVEGVVVSADRAIASARQTVGGSRPRARLSWQVTGDALRRVWTIELDGAPPGPAALQVRVDAVSGAVMAVDDLTDADVPLALVYRESPLVDPVPTVEALPLAILAMSDARTEVRQCRDQGQLDHWQLESGDTLDVHVCTVVPADGPVDGDYLYEPVPYPDEPALDEDDFAGPQVYWNVHHGLEWFDALGWIASADFNPRLLLTVNQRNTDFWTAETTSDPTLPLQPYDNAYSTGGYLDYNDAWIAPELVFGQGSTADFGYDATVVHHELGHFVVHSQHGPSFSENTPFGPSYRASTLNEGLADYFSAAIHGYPEIGGYVSEGGVRDLSGATTCAADLVGEPHYDSLPFSQGLWGFRASLPEVDRPTFDAIVLDSLSIMGENADLPDGASVVEGLVAERLGPDREAELAASWEARGVHECLPVRDIAPGDQPFAPYALIPGSYWFSTVGEMPGTLQYRVEVPEGGARLTLQLDQAQYLGFDPFEQNAVQPLVVVGHSGDRLTWVEEDREATVTFDGTVFTLEVTEWVPDGEEVATTEDVSVFPHETNPHYEFHHQVAEWDVETPGTYVFQLTNGFERSAVGYDLGIQVGPIPPEVTTPPVDEEDPVVADEDPVVAEPDPKGCGCGSTGPSGLLALGFAVLGLRRRR